VAGPEQLPPPEATADEIRRTAEEILSRPEFQPEPQSLFERAASWFSERFNDLLTTLFSGGRNSIVAWIALVVVVGVIALLVVRILTSMRTDPAAAAGVVVESEPRRRAVDWEREAQEHASAGRWRDALRCRYRALVARLAASGAVDEVPGRTAGEYRLEVRRSRPDAAPPFGEATDLFEHAWYGHREVSSDDDERFRALADDVTAHTRT